MSTQTFPIDIDSELKGPRSSHIEHSERPHSAQLKNIRTEALVVEAPKADFKRQTIYLDEIRGDELLIEMKYSGICHTDIVLQQGLLPLCEFPAVFGHEGAGYIVAIGANVKDKNLHVGDAVLLSFNTCGTLNHGAVRISDGTTPGKLEDGRAVRTQYFGQSSFSKMSIVNEKCVVKYGAGTVLNVLKPKKEDSIVIFGIGSVGATALMAAKYLGVGKIIAVDIVTERLQMAKDLGATDTINSKNIPNVVEIIKDMTKGGATFAIDCTGLLKVIEDMIDCIGPLGTAATVGVPPPEGKIRIDALTFLLENKKYIGVIEGDSLPTKFIPQLMEMHQSGSFPIERLCKTYPVAHLEEAIHDMHTGKVIKPVLAW